MYVEVVSQGAPEQRAHTLSHPKAKPPSPYPACTIGTLTDSEPHGVKLRQFAHRQQNTKHNGGGGGLCMLRPQLRSDSGKGRSHTGLLTRT
jgi:hypothetical protein